VEVKYGLIDEAMGLAIEIVGAQKRGNANDSVAINQEASQNRLFSFYVLGRQPVNDHGRPPWLYS
jgi:hypothetical protein